MTDYNETLLHRHAEDDRAALKAFNRLYLYAVHSGNAVLAALAVLKALQKLQNAAARSGKHNVESTVETPAWVREGLWPTLQTLMNPVRRGGFVEKARTMRQHYLHWAKVEMHMAQKKVNQTAAMSALGGIHAEAYQRAFSRAKEWLDDELRHANQLDFQDENAKSLQPVEARDLVPTQQIAKLIKMIG